MKKAMQVWTDMRVSKKISVYLCFSQNFFQLSMEFNPPASLITVVYQKLLH